MPGDKSDTHLEINFWPENHLNRREDALSASFFSHGQSGFVTSSGNLATVRRRESAGQWTDVKAGSAEVTPNCFIVRDANGQQLAYVYYESEPGRRSAAKLLSKDEARRIASNIAKLPELLHVGQKISPDICRG